MMQAKTDHTREDAAQEASNAGANHVGARLQARTDYPVQRKAVNNTGLPDAFKDTIESTFKTNLDNLQLKTNSSFPAKVGAIATAQKDRIDIAPGHFNPTTTAGKQLIGHEVWHTVQQAQGRVKPTMQMKSGHAINDDKHLEAEADRMGAAVASGTSAPVQRKQDHTCQYGAIQLTAVDKTGAPIPSLDDQTSEDGAAIEQLKKDDTFRIFENQQEAIDYAAGATDNIGWSEKVETWFRLEAKTVLVLGEHHEQFTLADLVRAIRTDRFLYEPYLDVFGLQGLERTQAHLQQRHNALNAKMERPEYEAKAAGHALESIEPKVAEGLRFTVQWLLNRFNATGPIKQGGLYSSEAKNTMPYLRLAFDMALDLATSDKRIAKWVETNGVSVIQKLSATLETLDGDDRYLGNYFEQLGVSGKVNLLSFCRAMGIALVYRSKKQSADEFHQSKDFLQIAAWFNSATQTTATRTNEQVAERTNAWREQHMLQKIRDAGDVLVVGMGGAHAENLSETITSLGGYRVVQMADFVKEQQQMNKAVHQKYANREFNDRRFWRQPLPDVEDLSDLEQDDAV